MHLAEDTLYQGTASAPATQAAAHPSRTGPPVRTRDKYPQPCGVPFAGADVLLFPLCGLVSGALFCFVFFSVLFTGGAAAGAGASFDALCPCAVCPWDEPSPEACGCVPVTAFAAPFAAGADEDCPVPEFVTVCDPFCGAGAVLCKAGAALCEAGCATLLSGATPLPFELPAPAGATAPGT